MRYIRIPGIFNSEFSNELIAYRLDVKDDAVFDIKLFYSSESNRNEKCELDTGFFILNLEQVLNYTDAYI